MRALPRRTGNPLFARLKDLTSDNKDQQKRLDEIKPLLLSKFKELQQTIDLRKGQKGQKGFDAALEVVKTNEGKQIMDRVRKVAGDVRDVELNLLKDREDKARTYVQITNWAIGVATVLAIGVVAVAGFILVRSIPQGARSPSAAGGDGKDRTRRAGVSSEHPEQ